MRARILDLDGSLTQQSLLMRRARPTILPLQSWGPSLRMACSHRHFRRFEEHFTQLAGSGCDRNPCLTFVGSGDFHHVSLALLRRLRGSCNLLVIDNHPDWMRGIPFLHCGTWLWHAARLPSVRRIFHVGGEVDFDNYYRRLAPWSLLRSGKIIVGPPRSRYRGCEWQSIKHRPLRSRADRPADRADIEEWLAPYRADLASCPLYISLDKDVLTADESVVNWDSGCLTVPEVLALLETFRYVADGDLIGVDIVGDWSPVRLEGFLRRLLHWTEHPQQRIDANESARRNEALNVRLLERLAFEDCRMSLLAQN
jgi:hypothetical protein